MKKIFVMLLMVGLTCVFTACGQENTEESVLSTATPVPTATTTPTPPRTEEEYRQEIAKLEKDTTAIGTVREYYEQLLAMDVLTEEDYRKLAEIYAAEGNQQGQADLLTKVHRLYPSVEYVEALSALIWDKDSSDSDMAEFKGQIIDLLSNENAEEMYHLINSDKWMNTLQSQLAGVITRTRYVDGEQTIQISSDPYVTEIVSMLDKKEMLYYKWDGKGTTIVKAELADGHYQGAFTMALFEEEHSLKCRYSGTMQGNVCIDELQITYEGKEYMGHFDEKGVTLEEQIASVTKNGDVIYAYTENERNYLYEKENTVADFRIDSVLLNLPTYEAW